MDKLLEDINDALKLIKNSNGILKDIMDKTPDQIEKMIASNEEMNKPPQDPELINDYADDIDKNKANID